MAPLTMTQLGQLERQGTVGLLEASHYQIFREEL
jgi:hypothetical protein